MMKPIIIGVSLIAAVSFLLMSIVTSYNLFTLTLDSEAIVRSELWILMIATFTAGVILLSIAWGIAELGANRVRRDALSDDE